MIKRLLDIKNININPIRCLNLNSKSLFLKKLTKGNANGPIDRAEKTIMLLLVPIGEASTAKTTSDARVSFFNARFLTSD
jgi:hypothetical protein